MAAVPQSRMEVLRTLRSANLDVAFVTVFVTAVGGSFLVGCIKYFGGGDYWVGLSSSIGTIVGLFQIPGAAWGKSRETFKSFIAIGGWTWRLLYIPVALLPLIPIANDAKLWILMACIGVGGSMVNLVGSTYNEWLGILVPERNRGWFFSQRTLFTTVIGAASGWVAGLVLDQFKRFNNEGIGYSAIFGVGCVAGIISMLCYMQMVDVPRPVVTRSNLSTTIKQSLEPLKGKNFRNLLTFTAIFAASQTFMGNFTSAYALESLKLPFGVLTLTGVFHAIGTVAMVKAWGFLADKYGNKPVLSLLMFGAVLTPLMWVFCRQNDTAFNAVLLLTLHLFNGAIWSGIGVSQFNLNLSAGRPEQRANSLAALGALAAIAGGLAPFAASAMMNSLRMATNDPYHSYQMIFYTTSLIRIVALFALIPVHEQGATSIRATLRQLRSIRPSGVVALRAIQSSDDQDDRAAAIERVGTTQFTLATSELATALADPSPRVRRQAAISLGRLGTPEAAHAILRHIESHPDLIEDEMLEGLVQAPVAESVPYLMKALDHPRALLRRTAARALGRIGDPSAVDALCTAALRPGDQDLQRASLQALRELGIGEPAFEAYRNALMDKSYSVRTAAAEAISELELRPLAPDLRQMLKDSDNNPVPEAIYALGCVGDLTDIEIMLHSATKLQSRSTRRRGLLGVAKLLGVEADVYRLMSLEGMARDTALFQLVRREMRRDEALTEAVERYSSGDEPAAVHILAKTRGTEVYRELEKCPIDETFLVAVAAFVQPIEA